MTDLWSDDALPNLHFSISQLLTRYARGVDRRDWPLLRSLFHADSVDEHGFTAGDVEEFIESFSRRSAAVPQMMHVNSNTLILDRDPERCEALVETYCVAWSRVLPGQMLPGSFYDSPLVAADSPNARLATIANRYLDLVAERDGELRFLFRRVVFEWVTVAEVQAESPFAEGMWTGTRDDTDPSTQTLEGFRGEYLSRRAVVHPTL